MQKRNTKRPQKRTTAWLVASIFSAALMAGCLGDGEPDAASNEPPTARLAMERNVGWTQEAIAFDARASSDPDGNVTSWRFDFGDGTTLEVDSRDQANVSHKYAKGGDYVVTLTVFDDGAQDAGSESDTTSVVVRINERHVVSGQVLYAGPANTTASAKYTREFEVQKGADALEVNLDITSVLVAGQSQIRLRILDADDEPLADQNVTVDAGQTKAANMTVSIETTGVFTLEAMAVSGGAEIEGEILVLHAA
jgi:PKD repeat protein